MPSRHVTYSVSDTQFTVGQRGLQNTSMLMMQINGGTAQPLAEGVEDMQIAYGFDTDGDGIIFDNGAAADATSGSTTTPATRSPVDCTIANLRAIRVTLVAKSTSVDSGRPTSRRDRPPRITPPAPHRRLHPPRRCAPKSP